MLVRRATDNKPRDVIQFSVILPGSQKTAALLAETDAIRSIEKARVHHPARRRGGGVAVAARAQQPERMRRVGVLLPAAADDPVFQDRVGAFLQGLERSGWTIGRNVRIDTRWATANAAEIRKHAADLAARAPDVILAHGGSTVGSLLEVTRSVPIVFPVIGDPVGAGFVESLARPGATPPVPLERI